MVPSRVNAVVLAGGTGARFWPLARAMSPKQLLSVFGTESLLAQAVRSVSSFIQDAGGLMVILTNEVLVDEVRNTMTSDTLYDGTSVEYAVEPLGRGTGPAAILMAAYFEQIDPEAALVILPSNPVYEADELWESSLQTAVKQALNGGVTVLRSGSSETSDDGVWVFQPRTLLEVLRKSDSVGQHMVSTCARVAMQPIAAWTSDHSRDTFSSVPEISIGELMGARMDVSVVPVSHPLRDVDDLGALSTLAPANEHGVVRLGRGVDIDSQNTIVYSPERLVSTVGTNDLIIADTADALLVADRARLADVSRIVEALRAKGAPEAIAPRVSKRPWGTWMTVSKGEGFHVKLIEVLPGARLSTQRHQFRSEHWVVVDGLAEILCDEVTLVLGPGESHYIPVQAIHRLANTGDQPLLLVEVQVGGILAEDDIERLEDDYQRT